MNQPTYPRKCERCNGGGLITVYLSQPRSTPYRFAQRDGCKVPHIVQCDSCERGQVTELTRGRYLFGIGGPAWDRWKGQFPTLATQLGA